MAQSDPVVIVTAADARFAMPMTVSLFSALRRLDRRHPAHVFIIDDRISTEDKSRCSAIVHSAHPAVTLRWLTPDVTTFERLRPAAWHSRAIYLRLLIPDLIPEHYDRVLYLDSDIIVTGDLSLLWSLDISEHPYWAVENFAPPTLAEALPTIAPALNAPPGARYHNSGVLLMNMPRWRADNISERAAAFLERYDGQISFGDQDALNGIMKGSWGRLSAKWNVQLLTLSDREDGDGDATERTRRRAALLKEPGVLHYTGPRKPWHWRYRGLGERDFFLEYLASHWSSSAPALLQVAGWFTSHAAFRWLAAAKRMLNRTGGTSLANSAA